MVGEELPRVSIVIVNYNGAKHLNACLDSLKRLNYPSQRVQIIVVDNASKDESVSLLKKEYPEIKLILNDKNQGFAKAVNQGVEAADGSYVALLNNDMKVDKEWLIELVEPLMEDSELACTGSKVLDWEGKKIDFVLGGMNWEGRGFQIDFHKPLRKGEYDKARDILFATGGAMLVDKEIFLNVGGFDEDYFAFYEDVDFGWRLWIAGFRVRFIPTSIVYHRHHGTASAFNEEKLHLLYERNALFSIYKNYSQPVLDRVLAAALLLLNKRTYLNLGIDKETYRLTYNGKSKTKDAQVPKKAISYVLAVDDFIAHLPKLREKRHKVQALRRRSDELLFRLFGEIFFSILPGKEYQDSQIEVQHSLGIYDLILKPNRNKVLILTQEVVADKMAGPGIRCWEIAKVLAQENDVTLAVPNENPKEHTLFKVQTYKEDLDIKEMAKQVDIIICQGMTLAASPFLTELGKILVVDIYDPFVLSLLEQYKDLDSKRRLELSGLIMQHLEFQLEKGDYFICASEKQRDFWIGVLTGLGRINPQTYDNDVTLKKLVDVVPFGIPKEKPRKTKKVIKGVIGGIGEKDKVVLWGGGIYNWFDPLSLIRAFSLVKERRTDIKLLFMGIKHPNPDVPEMAMASKAIELSQELELLDNTVFFNYGWVPYEERANYLLEADIGVSTHYNHIETRFSFRTRMLDCLWTQLPIICTKGDAISELVEKEKLGLTVSEQDVEGLADAIIKLAEDKNFYRQCQKNIGNIQNHFTWEQALKPLLDFCRLPSKAPDNTQVEVTSDSPNHISYIGKFREIARDHGFAEAVRRGINYIIKPRVEE